MNRALKGLLAATAIASSMTAHAALTSVKGSDGNLMVSDSTLNVTWADVASPNNLTWDSSGGPGSAQAWVASLNAANYGGYNNWTLPTGDGDYTNESCGSDCGPSTSATDNQLDYLFVNELGNTPNSPITNTSPFQHSINLSILTGGPNPVYWSSTLFAPKPDIDAWAFDTSVARGADISFPVGESVLAVRSGQVCQDPGGGIISCAPPLVLACPASTAQAGTSYNSSLAASGGVPPYTFSIVNGSLPAGLTLNTSTGAITGTPSMVGPFSFIGNLADSSGLVSAETTTANCTITVSPQLNVTPSSLNFGTVPRFSLRYRTVILNNLGVGTVSLGKVSVTPRSDDFLTLSFCRSSLSAGQSCLIIVVCFAEDLGALSATLNIPNNGTASAQAVPLSATVIKDSP